MADVLDNQGANDEVQDFGSQDTELSGVLNTEGVEAQPVDTPVPVAEATADKPERKSKVPTDPRVYRHVVTQTYGPLNDDQIWSLATILYDNGQIGGEGTSTQRPVRSAASEWLGSNDGDLLNASSAEDQMKNDFQKALKIVRYAEFLGYKSEFTAESASAETSPESDPSPSHVENA
jgi:hypothetical protein